MSMRADAGRGVGGAEGPAPQHAVGPEVGAEGELAPDLRDPVGAACAVADTSAGARVGPVGRVRGGRSDDRLTVPPLRRWCRCGPGPAITGCDRTAETIRP